MGADVGVVIEILATFRKYAPESTFIFNRSPNTTLEAIERHYKINSDCSKTPGKDLVST